MSLINHYETSKQYEEKKRKKYEIWRMRVSTPLGYVQDSHSFVLSTHGVTTSPARLRKDVRSKNLEMRNTEIEQGFTSRSELLSSRIGSISGFDDNRNLDDNMFVSHKHYSQLERPLDSTSVEEVVQNRKRGKRRPKAKLMKRRPASRGSTVSSRDTYEKGPKRASSSSNRNNWDQSFTRDTPISNYRLSDDINIGPRLKSFRKNVNKLIDEAERDYQQTRRSRLKLEIGSKRRSRTAQSDVSVLMADLLHDGRVMDSRLSNNQRNSTRSVTPGGRRRSFENQQRVNNRRRSQSALETRRRISNTSLSYDGGFRYPRPASAHPSRRHVNRTTSILKNHDVDWATFKILKNDDDHDTPLAEDATFDDCKAVLMRLWENLNVPLNVQMDFMERHFVKWSTFNESSILSQINRLTVTRQELTQIIESIRDYKEQNTDKQTRQQSLKLLSHIKEWMKNNSDLYPSYQFMWNGKDMIRLLSVASHKRSNSPESS